MNSSCSIIKYYKEPIEKYVLLSTVLFIPEKYLKLTYGKIRDERNKKQKLFMEKIILISEQLLNNYFPSNYYYRIYFDDSVKINSLWQNIFKILLKHPKIQLVKYNCPKFKNENHFKLFGTIMRFHPIFEKNNTELICVVDADNQFSKDWISEIEKFRISNKLIHTFQGILEAPFYKMDWNINKKDNIDSIFFRAGMFSTKMKFDSKKWDELLNLKEINQSFRNILNYLDFKKYTFFKESEELSFYNFEYGYDEILINFFFKYIIQIKLNDVLITPFYNYNFEKLFRQRIELFFNYSKRKYPTYFEIIIKKKSNIFKLIKYERFNNLMEILYNLKNELRNLYLQSDFLNLIENYKKLKEKYKNAKQFNSYLK
jgi:hypothetical protein